MNLGVSTLFYLKEAPCQAVGALAEKGFRTIEVVSESPHILSGSDASGLARLRIDYGLDYSVHAPWMTLNPGHMNGEVRRANRRLFSSCIRAAARIKATHIVTHGSRMVSFYRNVGYPEHELLEAFAREMKPIVQEAADRGIRVLFENTVSPGEVFSTPKMLFQVMEATGAGFCLDIAHAEVTSKCHELLTKKPDYLHAVDADLKLNRDSHSEIGKGDIDFNWWAKALKDAGFAGKVIIENRELEDSHRKLVKLWKDV